MKVYRIVPTQYAYDLSGEGARLHGGRWNHKMTPCIYTAENSALAVLEYTVNISMEAIPRALSIVCINIPDTGIYPVPIAALPGNWKDYPAPPSTMDMGTAWLEAMEHPAIRIPSTVLPQAFNYLLNPLHPAATGFSILSVDDFVYDLRIKTV
jgi:RES domain-containing protein